MSPLTLSEVDIRYAYRFSPYRMFLGIVFVTSLLAGGAFAIKIITIIGISLPGSIVLFPVTYIAITTIYEVYGVRTANIITLMGLFCLLMAVLTAMLVDIIPASSINQTWYFHMWRLAAMRTVVAFGGGFFVGQFLGITILEWGKRHGHFQSLYTRVALMPMIGQSMSGAAVALFGFDLPAHAVFGLLVNRVVFAVLYAGITAPIIYLLVEQVRMLERRMALQWIEQVRALPNLHKLFQAEEEQKRAGDH